MQDEFCKNVINYSNFEYLYVTFLESLYDDIEHSFNSVNRKRFQRSLPDAYSPSQRTLYYSMGCLQHSHFITIGDVCKPCPLLPAHATPADKNIYGEIYAVKKQRFDKMIATILKECDEIDHVKLVYQCEWEAEMRKPGSDVYNFYNNGNSDLTSKTKAPPPLAPRAGKKVYMFVK